MTKLADVMFLNGGYCVQNAWFAGEASWRFRRFYATFVCFRHPSHGECLIDCAYGPDYLRATRFPPARAMRWTLPFTTVDTRDVEQRWSERGIDRRKLTALFVSHFHGDHIGALGDFAGTDVRFVYRRSEREHLKGLGYFSQLQSGYLDALVPDDFDARGIAIEESEFAAGQGDLSEFRVRDWWGDGSLIVVDLPGHSIGHLGYVLNAESGPIFFVVDATWSVPALLAGRKIPWPARSVQHSWSDYLATQDKLRRLSRTTGMPLVACHCPETQRRVVARIGSSPTSEAAG